MPRPPSLRLSKPARPAPAHVRQHPPLPNSAPQRTHAPAAFCDSCPLPDPACEVVFGPVTWNVTDRRGINVPVDIANLIQDIIPAGVLYTSGTHRYPGRRNGFTNVAFISSRSLSLVVLPVLIFGFASKSSVHRIVPIIGTALYLPGIFLNFQSILMYVTSAYPAYAASVLAGNDFFRSAIASLGRGSALLGGISFRLMPVLWVLLKYGHVLRQRSKYAHSP
ncbi:hypothetical protein DFH08DRAFT_814826 [Mycena albidolilacea]|uniref:Uncharacterized protein n=1 Tax=Mycena albidolilacea TaxID=1033008 RepID=A0AAD6ZQD5_9AGAR|nr:hypothetical protein DFH08DRAFT_814826 [Mycena albidolilacea]